MTLIIVILCLALHRYAGAGAYVQKLDWFPGYVKLTAPLFKKLTASDGVLGVVVMLAPLFLMAGIIYLFLSMFLHGLLAALFCFAVFLMCIDAGDWSQALADYLKSGATPAKARKSAEAFVGGALPEEAAKMDRAVTREVLSRAFERIFVVMFWFAIFGASGAITYYALYQFNQKTVKSPEFSAFKNGGVLVQGVLDWVPVRLLGLGYALVGSFGAAFTLFLKKLVGGLSGATKLACSFGLAGLSIKEGEASTEGSAETRMALDMVDRAIILWVVVIALVTVGGWLS